MKKAKCKICKNEFFKTSIKHVCCGYDCLLIHIKNEKDKKWKEKKKKLKEGIETKSEILRKTQQIFNKFIRFRDAGKPCISCSRPLAKKFDAGHFLSVGQNKIVRFNEDNVHGQCVHCNRSLHGNLLNYQLGLVERIGQKRFNKVMENLNKTKNYTIAELKEIQEIYKKKIKGFEL